MNSWRKVFGYIILMLIALSMLYPFISMVNLSFVPNGEIFAQNGKLFYSHLTLENYANVFHKQFVCSACNDFRAGYIFRFCGVCFCKNAFQIQRFNIRYYINNNACPPAG